MRLPYGRRVACYWLRQWRPTLLRLVWRLGHAWVLKIGPIRIVLYSGRMDWLDADRAVAKQAQRHDRGRG